MHVLVLPTFYPTDLYPIGGKFFKDQVIALRKHGLDVGVAYTNSRSIRRGLSLPALLTHRFQPVATTEDGIPTVRIMSWNLLGQYYPAALLCGTLLARAARHYIALHGRPDVIHAHQARWAGHGALLLARQLGLPYVITEHESYFAEGKIPARELPHLRTIYAGASRVIAVSRAMAEAMAAVYDPARVTVIPNMVDPDYFALPAAPRAAAPFTFLCVARLAQIKRLDLLIAAFQDAFPGDDGVRLRIVGHGPEYAALQQQAQAPALGGRVTLCGELEHDGVLAEMQRADAFVLCSEVETFGVVLIEAMSCGLPVIATRCGGPRDIVTDDVGLLVDCDDVGQLAAALRRMRDTRAAYDPAALHAAAAARFGERVVSARLAAVYAEVCGGRP